ncbi:MAG: MBL fold metallo-hydrolase [Acidobacteria bacterium]|nr:MBL fold metallo-hydrolase [Acidobacteriota bacterium]
MTARISSVMGNSQKLDGGAMFGNAPKALWSRWVSADQANRIDLACRAMLVETSHEKWLFETGIGAYMPPHLRDRYGVQESHHVLLASLKQLDLEPEDIDVIVLSHLHFDHAGGLLTPWQNQEPPALLFPNARILVGRKAWQRACEPHPRDRASFIPELMTLLERGNRTQLLAGDEQFDLGGVTLRFFESNGHTPGMMCSELVGETGTLVFAADLIPGQPWVHVPITMGYDRFPEQLIDEKHELLTRLAATHGRLFFTHDPHVASGCVTRDESGRKFQVTNNLESLIRVGFTDL